MFQYAYARELKEKGMEVRLDLKRSYDKVFGRYRNHAVRENRIQNFKISIPPIDVYKYGKYEYLKRDTLIRKAVYWMACHSLWKYKLYEEQEPDYSYEKAEIKGNYYVKGWFQSEEYFKDIRSVLLREFVPRKQIRLSKELREAFENLESVSIHIRRGDLVKLSNLLNPVYYEKAVSKIKQIYKNPVFLVFSDDLKWVKQNMHIDGRVVYVNEGGKLQDYEELFIMSRCKSNIIANSTFSWWAAWLNQNEKKIVIAPKGWGKRIAPPQWMLL